MNALHGQDLFHYQTAPITWCGKPIDYDVVVTWPLECVTCKTCRRAYEATARKQKERRMRAKERQKKVDA